MFGKVILRPKTEKNDWRNSFQDRKSLWEQKAVKNSEERPWSCILPEKVRKESDSNIVLLKKPKT